MYYSSHSHPTAALMPPAESIMTKFRLNGCAWVLLCQCLVLTLPVLKLAGIGDVADWSWIWVAAPIWGPGALLILVLAVEWMADLGKPAAMRRPSLVGDDESEAGFEK